MSDSKDRSVCEACGDPILEFQPTATDNDGNVFHAACVEAEGMTLDDGEELDFESEPEDYGEGEFDGDDDE